MDLRVGEAVWRILKKRYLRSLWWRISASS